MSDAVAKVLHSCNPGKKQGVTAEQKLCSENKGELKNLAAHIEFSRWRKGSGVGEETTWSGRLFQTGIVRVKKKICKGHLTGSVE